MGVMEEEAKDMSEEELVLSGKDQSMEEELMVDMEEEEVTEVEDMEEAMVMATIPRVAKEETVDTMVVVTIQRVAKEETVETKMAEIQPFMMIESLPSLRRGYWRIHNGVV